MLQTLIQHQNQTRWMKKPCYCFWQKAHNGPSASERIQPTQLSGSENRVSDF